MPSQRQAKAKGRTLRAALTALNQDQVIRPLAVVRQPGAVTILGVPIPKV